MWLGLRRRYSGRIGATRTASVLLGQRRRCSDCVGATRTVSVLLGLRRCYSGRVGVTRTVSVLPGQRRRCSDSVGATRTMPVLVGLCRCYSGRVGVTRTVSVVLDRVCVNWAPLPGTAPTSPPPGHAPLLYCRRAKSVVHVRVGWCWLTCAGGLPWHCHVFRAR